MVQFFKVIWPLFAASKRPIPFSQFVIGSLVLPEQFLCFDQMVNQTLVLESPPFV